MRYAIADDHELFRHGFSSMLTSFSDLEFTFEAYNGLDLVEKLASKPVDLVYLDLQMPVMDGIQATEIIVNNYPHVRILIVSMYSETRFVKHLMDIGAHAYLLKDSTPEVVLKISREVYNGAKNFDILKEPDFTEQILTTFFQNSKIGDISFTSREIEILSLMIKGHSIAEISSMLLTSINHINNIIFRLKEKTKSESIPQLFAYVYNHFD